MKFIKRRVDFIEAIICIHNGTFDFAALNVCHTAHKKTMGYCFL